MMTSNVFPQNYILKAPQTSTVEFLSFVETEEIIPYSRKQLENIRKNNQSEKEDLLSLLEQAQESFLKDHLKSSSEYFYTIVKKVHDRDWGEESRKIIFYSFLRLSQIENKEESSEIFLHSAIVFAPELEPDKKLFPPPLVEKFNKIKAGLPRISIRFRDIFPLHEVLLVNGREISVQKKLNFPNGEYRVTALSSSHKTWRQVTSLSKLIRKRIITPAWVKGSCTQPIISKNLKRHWVLFPHFCLWKQPFLETPKDKALSQQVLIDQKDQFQLKKYSKWVLLGTGLVILALIFIPNVKTPPGEKEIESKPRPTRKVGF